MSRAPNTRLMLITPVIEDADAFAEGLGAAMGAADVAACIIRLAPTDERKRLARAKRLLAAVQSTGAAGIIEATPDLVGKSGADGLHVLGAGAELGELTERFQPEKIVGAGRLPARHDAMTAGEAGVDYVLFGDDATEIGALLDRVEWWADLFEIPCVAVARRPEEVRALAEAVADFVALGDWVFGAAEGPAAAVESAARAIERQAAD
jgi:thiamine-phosphate pyrophosphorylase